MEIKVVIWRLLSGRWRVPRSQLLAIALAFCGFVSLLCHSADAKESQLNYSNHPFAYSNEHFLFPSKQNAFVHRCTEYFGEPCLDPGARYVAEPETLPGSIKKRAWVTIEERLESFESLTSNLLGVYQLTADQSVWVHRRDLGDIIPLSYPLNADVQLDDFEFFFASFDEEVGTGIGRQFGPVAIHTIDSAKELRSLRRSASSARAMTPQPKAQIEKPIEDGPQNVLTRLPKAMMGIPSAQYDVANLFLGIAMLTDEDLEAALYWLGLAAEGEFKKAFGSLSHFSSMGRKRLEGRPSLTRARGIFLDAAKKGNPDAQYYLGKDYVSDIGVFSEEPKKGIWWLWQAASDNHDWAQVELAHQYLEGRNVERDVERARYWFERAAALGNTQASEALVQLRSEETATSSHPSAADDGLVMGEKLTLGLLALAGIKTLDSILSGSDQSGQKPHGSSEPDTCAARVRSRILECNDYNSANCDSVGCELYTTCIGYGQSSPPSRCNYTTGKTWQPTWRGTFYCDPENGAADKSFEIALTDSIAKACD